MKNKVETATATPPKDHMVVDGEAAVAQAAMTQAVATADVCNYIRMLFFNLIIQ